MGSQNCPSQCLTFSRSFLTQNTSIYQKRIYSDLNTFESSLRNWIIKMNKLYIQLYKFMIIRSPKVTYISLLIRCIENIQECNRNSSSRTIQYSHFFLFWNIGLFYMTVTFSNLFKKSSVETFCQYWYTSTFKLKIYKQNIRKCYCWAMQLNSKQTFIQIQIFSISNYYYYRVLNSYIIKQVCLCCRTMNTVEIIWNVKIFYMTVLKIHYSCW